MRSLTSVTPARAAVTAATLVVLNPKVLFICAAAGLAIGTAGLGATGAWLADVLLRGCSPRRRSRSRCSPTSMFADHLERPLARLKDWLERHNAALVAVILVVIGLMVLYKGIHGL